MAKSWEDTASNHGPKDHQTALKNPQLTLTTIITSSAKF